MSPEQQRISIAEACGWKCIGGCHEPDYKGWVNTNATPKDGMVALPDYLNDLNAMHEAEKILTPRQKWEYIPALVSDSTSNVVFSTAAQRAEAFLRTIGKWDDSK